MSEPINSEKLININCFETNDAFLGHIPEAGELNFVNVDNDAPFKQMVINLMMPDYSTGISISSGWVANKQGWVVAVHGYNVSLGTAYVNSVVVFQAGADSYGGAGIFPVNIGDTVTSNNLSSLTFYPCNEAS